MWLKWSATHLHIFVEFVPEELFLCFSFLLECHVLAILVVCFVTFLREILCIVSASFALDVAPIGGIV